MPGIVRENPDVATVAAPEQLDLPWRKEDRRIFEQAADIRQSVQQRRVRMLGSSSRMWRQEHRARCFRIRFKRIRRCSSRCRARWPTATGRCRGRMSCRPRKSGVTGSLSCGTVPTRGAAWRAKDRRGFRTWPFWPKGRTTGAGAPCCINKTGEQKVSDSDDISGHHDRGTARTDTRKQGRRTDA